MRIPRALVVLAAVLLLAGTCLAGQPVQPVQGLDSLTPEEQARVRENLERWQQLSPEERQRIRENYQR
ncbi:MAG TPA: DUF3106 domain-containing protein, partial [Candidatus Sulfotelmatobacter sp.]|nr:DUF3106 domain-containing protein [Candidatus Sulfotelmatobacter sp.]